MNISSDLTDEEFIPFLNSLGVETYKKSFDWMLNDPDFAYVLQWIYSSLDENNILSPREEYRYSELEKRGTLLSAEDLESRVNEIQQEYPGICLPGDKDTMAEVKCNITMQVERSNMLTKQEKILADTIKKNEKIKQELNVEITKLNAALQQCSDDEISVGEDCVFLAEEVELLTNDVVDVTANALNLYASCNTNMDIAKRFFTYGPIDTYIQSQALFRSHFNLYTSKKFVKKHNDFEMNQDIHVPLEAEKIEERLLNSLHAYIKSKVRLSGEQAKLGLVVNCNKIHPSQISSCMREAQSAIALLDQEEAILDHEIQSAVQRFVKMRTRLVMGPVARGLLDFREQIFRDLRSLHSLTQRALHIDKLTYCCLRNELHSTQQLLHFAAQLRECLSSESSAVACRVKSMYDICSEQETVERKLQESDDVLRELVSIFGKSSNADPVKMYNDLKVEMLALKENIQDGFQQKEDDLRDIKLSTKPLQDYIWDGCTKKPNCYNRSVSALRHQLRQEMEKIDDRIIKTSSVFNSVKNGDKQNLRKLWQWFLTDQGRFLAAIKNLQ